MPAFSVKSEFLHFSALYMKMKLSIKADDKRLGKSGTTRTNVSSSDHLHVFHSVVSYYREVRTRVLSLNTFW